MNKFCTCRQALFNYEELYFVMVTLDGNVSVYSGKYIIRYWLLAETKILYSAIFQIRMNIERKNIQYDHITFHLKANENDSPELEACMDSLYIKASSLSI